MADITARYHPPDGKDKASHDLALLKRKLMKILALWAILVAIALLALRTK